MAVVAAASAAVVAEAVVAAAASAAAAVVAEAAAVVAEAAVVVAEAAVVAEATAAAIAGKYHKSEFFRTAACFAGLLTRASEMGGRRVWAPVSEQCLVPHATPIAASPSFAGWDQSV